MVGIYKITNLLTGEVYIGQSKDLERRKASHKNPDPNTIIGYNMLKIGIENFHFEVIEECSEDQLDEREDYYIQYYHSTDYGFGYNEIRGGINNRGESNPNCHLTEREVYDIREAYKNHEYKWGVYEQYKHRVSKYYFSNLWEGRSWQNIHMDVYTPQNIEYCKNGTSVGERSIFARFSNDEVLELRKRYMYESAKEIYESVKDKCKYETLQMILWGRYYPEVPVYSKKKKKWINVKPVTTISVRESELTP
jgi:group I intron endonuclease